MATSLFEQKARVILSVAKNSADWNWWCSVESAPRVICEILRCAQNDTSKLTYYPLDRNGAFAASFASLYVGEPERSFFAHPD